MNLSRHYKIPDSKSKISIPSEFKTFFSSATLIFSSLILLISAFQIKPAISMTEMHQTASLQHTWTAFTLDENVENWTLSIESNGRLDGGRLNSIPRVSYNRGIGSRADMTISFEMLNLDNPKVFEGNSGPGDVRIAFRINTLKRGASRGSLIFLTKLPNADETEGLGTDQTDFHFLMALSRESRKSLLSLNLGIGILGKPDVDNLPKLINVPNLNFGLIKSNQGTSVMGPYTESSGQTDVFDYGIAMVRSISENCHLILEIEGFRDNGGTFEDICFARAGITSSIGKNRKVGFTVSRDVSENRPTGFSLGLTWIP
ncbi:MAG: hypothetical protein CVV64_07485 [Candidatus Wallbacteria bacterium HGW-Wallbacteria-1]|jgi:hypothetical protein|uniref:Uncharacterized protein n=1 Tax=Candidatus Wallbacteria bacterium HGW-Wallbacteria-1 TaxID=2013854 RepID=A0A2N1PQU3_9BACT|nr:MAG: hypothetical protein CVV64_07485 [Candidatus Wallbacteria bacterium HGW-Wallbacteria-1]